MSTPSAEWEKSQLSRPTDPQRPPALDASGRLCAGGTANDRFPSGGYAETPTAPASPTFERLHKTTTGGTAATGKCGSNIFSPSRAREEAHRPYDDLELMRAERVASKSSKDIYRAGSKRDRDFVARPDTTSDALEDETNPVHKTGKAWKPPSQPATQFAKCFKKVHESSWMVRYFTYIVPVALVLLIPLLVTAIRFPDHTTGGVYTKWVMIWLEVVWLGLWAGRIVSKLIPYPVGVLASAFTNGSKKWRDMAHMLEVPMTLFLWWLSIYISFLPIMKHNHADRDTAIKYWEKNANIILLCLFIATILNLVEKVIIQLIAISFHMRTYADRIELNKFQISSLAKLYKYAKQMERDFEEVPENTSSRNRTTSPKVALLQAREGAQRAFLQIGDVVGKIAGDFTGKEVNSSKSPQQVVLTLLQTTEGSNVLARRLYRSYVSQDEENVHAHDLLCVFADEEEGEAAFSMFDRDLNGDISCEEMELACVEIGRERKAIAASLKDLDSVIGKFDDCLTFIVAVIVILVFLSLISKSTAGILTSASSSILALSWLFSGTAQEFLASLIFVFVKHPFDVGDRVDIYNTGAGTIDTFYVREIALMYTEFKKLEGAIVQAPNSLLNTLFILNMRRTGGLAEAIPIVCKFGTTLAQIDELRERLLEFVKSEKREYQGKIITELRDIPDMHSVKLNVVFFYKSNWQNELVRLQRRNKFMCTLMCNIQELGIESPNMRWPGQKQSAPMYLSNVSPEQFASAATNASLPPPTPVGPSAPAEDFPDPSGSLQGARRGSATTLEHGGSIRGRKVDFSLGVKGMVAMDDSGDVWDDRPRRGLVPSGSLRRVTEEEESDPAKTTSIRSGESRGDRSFLHRRRTASTRGGSLERGPHDEEMGFPRPMHGRGRGNSIGSPPPSASNRARAMSSPPMPMPPPPVTVTQSTPREEIEMKMA